jgi:hypothetical protein
LPYTLVQDYTLAAVLGETTPRLWLQKVDFLAAHRGLVLVNTHPDYLKLPGMRELYTSFLGEMRSRGDYWHAVPKDVARWWAARASAASVGDLPGAVEGTMGWSLEGPGAEMARLSTAEVIASTSPVATRG